jgi:hypothetical protein
LPAAGADSKHNGEGVVTTHYPDIRQEGFALDVWHWPTVAAFRAHLAGYNYKATAPWARACIVHHTYKPAAADWRGPASMAGLARHYAGLGWSAGPHLFIAAGAPNPDHDGIWQLTPLSVPGIHGNDANGWAWGVEHVGDYDATRWPPDLAALGQGAMAALLDWAGQPATTLTLQPHSRYNPAKTCPGRAVDMRAVARGVAALQQPPVPRFTFTADALLVAPSPLGPDALVRALVKRCARGHYAPDAVAALASLYAALEKAVGVNAWLAAAQMCHETGNLTSARSAPPQHNLAGIGATNDGAQGVGFPDLAAAARAQVGRLLAYALPPGDRFGPQVQLVDEALRWRPLPLACQGSAPRLRLLGAEPNAVEGCGWASPGASYGAALAAAANALMEAGR